MEMVRSGEAPSPVEGEGGRPRCAAPTGKTNCLYTGLFPSSVTLCVTPVPIPSGPLAIIPTPFGLRPFPPDRGNRPLDKGVVLPYRLQEKLPSLGRGAPWGSRQNCTGSVGSAKAGAAVETLHLQFLQTQGPVARENTRTATQILRAGNSPPPYRYAFPVMGSGESSPMDLGGAKRSRSPSAASPAAFW